MYESEMEAELSMEKRAGRGGTAGFLTLSIGEEEGSIQLRGFGPGSGRLGDGSGDRLSDSDEAFLKVGDRDDQVVAPERQRSCQRRIERVSLVENPYAPLPRC